MHECVWNALNGIPDGFSQIVLIKDDLNEGFSMAGFSGYVGLTKKAQSWYKEILR